MNAPELQKDIDKICEEQDIISWFNNIQLSDGKSFYDFIMYNWYRAYLNSYLKDIKNDNIENTEHILYVTKNKKLDDSKLEMKFFKEHWDDVMEKDDDVVIYMRLRLTIGVKMNDYALMLKNNVMKHMLSFEEFREIFDSEDNAVEIIKGWLHYYGWLNFYNWKEN